MRRAVLPYTFFDGPVNGGGAGGQPPVRNQNVFFRKEKN